MKVSDQRDHGGLHILAKQVIINQWIGLRNNTFTMPWLAEFVKPKSKVLDLPMCLDTSTTSWSSAQH